MALYTRQSRDSVRDAVDFVELVGARTELRRAGPARYEGLCPFHEERTPSFGIDPAQKVYYCFGCQASGDVFTFVQETEGVDFRGALELLSERYGVELQLEQEDPREAQLRQARERLLELLGRTAGYYERYLWESEEAAHARDYLAERGLGEAILREFSVGYSPSAWDRVLVASKPGGFSARELYDAGLAQRSGGTGRIYDRFRSRIMFPLADIRGRVLGFGARALDHDEGGAAQRGEAAGRPKYLNTSDNDVYHKGRHLYGAAPGQAGRDEGGRGDPLRGLHRRDRAAPGRDPQRGGADGDRADRRAGRRAGADGPDGAAGAGRGHVPGRRRCCARRRWRRGASSSCGSCRCRRARTRPTDPARGARGDGRALWPARCRSCVSGSSGRSPAGDAAARRGGTGSLDELRPGVREDAAKARCARYLMKLAADSPRHAGAACSRRAGRGRHAAGRAERGGSPGAASGRGERRSARPNGARRARSRAGTRPSARSSRCASPRRSRARRRWRAWTSSATSRASCWCGRRGGCATATWRRRWPRSPGEPELGEDAELLALLAELIVQAAGEEPNPGMLEVQRLQLELAGLERGIQQARGREGVGRERRWRARRRS